MNRLYANTLNELEKIFLRKKYRVFLLLTALIPIGGAVSFHLFQSRLGIFAVNSTSFPILILGLITGLLLPLFIFSVAADIFAGEVGDKTLKLTLTRPINRFSVFLSKHLALGIFIVINLALVCLLSLLAGLFLQSATHRAVGTFQALLAYLVAMIPMLFLSMEAGFVAQFFKNSGGALTTSIFIYLAAKGLPLLSSNLGKVNPFAYTDWYMLWLGSPVGAGRILNIFLLLLSASLILFTIGFYLFDQKNL